MKIARTALVAHKATDMYSLVEDVPAYPQFLRWCTKAEIHESSPGHQLASLAVAVAGLEQRFKTRNVLVPGRSLGMSLVEGPFRALSGEWRFEQLGEMGSKVSLVMDFDFVPGLISGAFQRGFKSIADHLVSEFCRRADDVFSARAKTNNFL